MASAALKNASSNPLPLVDIASLNPNGPPPWQPKPREKYIPETLPKLTPEQEKFREARRTWWMKHALDAGPGLDANVAKEGMIWLYERVNLEKPEVLILDSPIAACQCAQLCGGEVTTTAGFGLGYDAGWLTSYDAYSQLGLMYDPDFERFMHIMSAGIWDTVILEGLAIISRRPVFAHLDEQERLHCPDGPAVRFNDGQEAFLWHNTVVDRRVIMDPESYTREELENSSNSEVSRALAERLGWERYLQKLEVKTVDTWVNPKTDCKYELLDFAKRLGSRQPRLLRMQSPVLHDGTRPHYIEPVDPELKTARAAYVWQFPKPIDLFEEQTKDGPEVEWPSVEEAQGEYGKNFAFETET